MRILEKIDQVRRGEVDVGDLPGSTTERMTIGLALNALEKTNPSFAGDERGAWERLDARQRAIVRQFNREYRKKKWLTVEDAAMADPMIAANARACAEAFIRRAKERVKTGQGERL